MPHRTREYFCRSADWEGNSAGDVEPVTAADLALNARSAAPTEIIQSEVRPTITASKVTVALPLLLSFTCLFVCVRVCVCVCLPQFQVKLRTDLGHI